MRGQETAGQVQAGLGELAARLGARQEEIAGQILLRAHAVADPSEVEDPAYALGLEEAVAGGLEYAISALAKDWQEPSSLPPQLLAQARAAARNGISLDTVLRRYAAGYSLLCDYVIEEAEGCGVVGARLKRALRVQTEVYDRVMAAISTEHSQEMDGCLPTSDEHRAALVKKLLGGDTVASAKLGYELDSWHIGAVATGPGAISALRELVAILDRKPLFVPCEASLWLWFGGQAKPCASEVAALAERTLPADVSLALGEPARDLDGWRLTHRQALAALSIARRGPRSVVLYSDVALLASVLRDEVLSSSLRTTYLEPLEAERDGGVVLRETLRTYLDSGHSVTSAAARLGIARQTVTVRLRAAEERIGRSLESCAVEASVALGLAELAENPRPLTDG